MTIKMVRIDDGKTGDIHRDEVAHMEAHGWKAVEGVVEVNLDKLGTDSGEQFSDDQLRGAIEVATGKKPHHKTGREKLVDTFNEINAAE